MRTSIPALLLIVCVACGRKPAPPDFDKLLQDFIYGSLAISPVTATATGYHKHLGVPLDELVDDYSAPSLESQHKFLTDFETRLGEWDASTLDKEQQADLDIVKSNIGFSLLELDTIQSYKHNPTIYVELAGNALYTPYVLNYAPVEQRFQHIIRRLTMLPALFEQARANLVDSPEVWNRVAREENQGNIDLIDKTLRAATPQAQKLDYEKAARPALATLREFNGYLADSLSKKPSDWRLGKEKYAKKFAFVLNTGGTPEQLLSAAETELARVRGEMAKLAAPQTVEQALAEIARQHATPDTYMSKAKATLAQATDFVRAKDLLTLPPR